MKRTEQSVRSPVAIASYGIHGQRGIHQDGTARDGVGTCLEGILIGLRRTEMNVVPSAIAETSRGHLKTGMRLQWWWENVAGFGGGR